jgi:cyclic pyranopterin phosphate synthase
VRFAIESPPLLLDGQQFRGSECREEIVVGELTHFGDDGASRMVDVSGKEVTHRRAVARGCVVMQPATLRLILDRGVAKGDVREVARLAGIMAAKRTSELIPLCHPLPITGLTVDFSVEGDSRLMVEAACNVDGKTGVEMEALTAVSVACLTVYDMCKGVDREMSITEIHLSEKSGGRSGHFVRSCAE